MGGVPAPPRLQGQEETMHMPLMIPEILEGYTAAIIHEILEG
jgi:hypothetical protein